MCPDQPSNLTPFSFKSIDRCHGLAETAEEIQTLCEGLAGDVYGKRVTVAQAHFTARRIHELSQVLAASAGRLVEEIPKSE